MKKTRKISKPKAPRVIILPEKEELLIKLDEAITRASFNSTGKETKLRFDFGLNGTLRINNTKKALIKIRKLIKKMPISELTTIQKTKINTKKRSISLREDIHKLYPTEDKTIFTNGKLLIKSCPPKTSKYEDREQITKKSTDAILATKTKPAKLCHYVTKDLEIGFGASIKPITSLNSTTPSLVVFKIKETKKFVHYNQTLFNTIRNRFENAVYSISDNGVLIAKVANKPVAALMPYAIENDEKNNPIVFTDVPLVKLKKSLLI